MSLYTVSSLISEIETYFTDNWPHTPIAYTNAAFEVPINDPWVRLNIIFFQSENAGIGTECVFLRGQISIQIFTRYDIGTGTSSDLVDKVIEVLQNQDINGIVTYAANVIQIGDAARQMNRIESEFYQINVTFDFETTS